MSVLIFAVLFVLCVVSAVYLRRTTSSVVTVGILLLLAFFNLLGLTGAAR